MFVSLLATGSEFTRGERFETNTNYLADILTNDGHNVANILVASDAQSSIEAMLGLASSQADVVIVTGGLGPTEDDRTRFAAAALSDMPLEFNDASWLRIKKIFSKYKISPTDNNRVQAMFPQGSQIIVNENGTADAFSMQIGKAQCFFLPGVPSEMRTLFEVIRKELRAQSSLYCCNYIFLGPGESILDKEIRDSVLPVLNSASSYAICVHYRFYAVRFWVESLKERRLLKKKMRSVFIENQVSRRPGTVWQCAVRLAIRLGVQIGFAESCTGGMAGQMITDVSGASSIFKGSIVSYSNSVKQNLLGVPSAVLDNFGAVSEECAVAMAQGAQKVLDVDIAIAVTGIAGPGGGTPAKPVGTVCFAITSGSETHTETQIFRGDRTAVRERAVSHLLSLLLIQLREVSKS